MLDKIKTQLKPDKLFLKSGIIVFAGSMVVNVANYLFHLVMGRSLGPSEYGVAVAIISFLALLSIPLSTVSTVVTKFSSEALAHNEMGEISFLFNKLSKFLGMLGIIITVMVIIFSKQIGDFLNLDPQYIKVISIFLTFSLLVAVTRGILQGVKSFTAYTINTVVEVIVKVGLFMLFFYLGLKTFSVVWALIASIVITYIVSIFPLKKIIRVKNKAIDLKVLLRYSSYALLALALISALTYVDVLLVKHFFTAEEAGYYAALATVGKIVIYIATPMILVMFPMISEAHTKNEKHFHLLAQTTAIIVASSTLILGVYYFAPEFVVNILYGQKYLVIGNYLFNFGLAIFLLTLANVLVYYFLSIKKLGFIWLVLVTAIAELALIYLYHDGIGQIVLDLIYAFGFLFLGLLIMYICIKKEKIIKVLKNA